MNKFYSKSMWYLVFVHVKNTYKLQLSVKNLLQKPANCISIDLNFYIVSPITRLRHMFLVNCPLFPKLQSVSSWQKGCQSYWSCWYPWSHCWAAQSTLSSVLPSSSFLQWPLFKNKNFFAEISCVVIFLFLFSCLSLSGKFQKKFKIHKKWE